MTHDQVYPPQEDSLLLLRAAVRETRPDDRVLEIGTGSGIIASSLPSCRFLVATDINPYAVREASMRGVPVVRTSMADGIRMRFDLVLCNPPYLPTTPLERLEDWLEYALDGGPDGTDMIRRFIRQLHQVLTSSGRALLLVSSLNRIESIGEYCLENGFSWNITDTERMPDGENLAVLRIYFKTPLPE